jgi:hypothetical protein
MTTTEKTTAEKTNRDYAIEDTNEIMEKLIEFGGGDFTDEESEKLFKDWLTDKIELIMDQMEE